MLHAEPGFKKTINVSAAAKPCTWEMSSPVKVRNIGRNWRNVSVGPAFGGRSDATSFAAN